jgi:hypothetical protein
LFLNIRVLELVIRVLKLIRGNILWVPLILVNPSIGTIGWLKVRILTNGLPEIRVLRGWWWSEIRVLRVKTLLRKSTRGISGIMMIEMLLLRRRLKGCVVIRGWLLNLMRRESTILVWNRRSTQGFAEVVAMDIV